MSDLLHLLQHPGTNPKSFISTICSTEIVDGHTWVELSESYFYPSGGGQPADTGIIFSENAEFKVIDVRLNVDGLVHHYGEFKKGSFQNGDVAKLSVEKEKSGEKSRSRNGMSPCSFSASSLASERTTESGPASSLMHCLRGQHMSSFARLISIFFLEFIQ